MTKVAATSLRHKCDMKFLTGIYFLTDLVGVKGLSGILGYPFEHNLIFMMIAHNKGPFTYYVIKI